MKREKKYRLIPELRFPEFAKDGEWEKKSFEELFEIGNGKDYKHLSKGEIPVYGSGGYMLSVNDYLYDGESVCIGRKGTIDKPIFLTGKFWTVDTLFYTHSFKNCLPKYVYYTFQNIDWLKHNEAGGVPSLSKANIYKIETLIPELQEQQKIASCLFSLDEVIAAHGQKLKALKDYKKGLMQNLFPQEGEKVPKYRFPEFAKDGEWEKEKLEVIGEPLMCKRILKEQTTSDPKDGVPFYKIGTFGRLADSFIPQKLYEDFKGKYSFPNKGDILISASGTIGRLVVYDGSPAYFQDSNIIWLENDEKLVLNIFLFHSYSTLKWQTSDGGVISRLYNSDLKNMQILFPKGKDEQQKIASCLSVLDALIMAHVEKIEQLKQHKKGLMQRLFPKVND